MNSISINIYNYTSCYYLYILLIHCRFDEELQIYSMFSDDREEVMMKEIISTLAARGCVERWLIQVRLYNIILFILYTFQYFYEIYKTIYEVYIQNNIF